MVKVLTSEQVSEAVRLYEEGASLNELADQFPVTAEALWYRLRTRTTMRSPGSLISGTRADDKAQGTMERAIKRGELIRASACEECSRDPGVAKDGRSKIDGHHDDYSKPLDVRWLCRKCHFAWRRINIAKGASIQELQVV